MATPAFVKRAMRTDAVQSALGFLMAFYFQLIAITSKIDRPPFPLEEPYIVALWHGRLFMLPALRNTGKPIVALVSGHRDGEVISRAGAYFKILTAKGSSTRGGMRAVRELLRCARDGHCLFVTPDGPRGPRMRADPGIVDLARLTGLPILPASISAARGLTLKSWDRFLLPGLFTTIVIRWGEPISVAAGDDRAQVSARLETAMIDLQNLADNTAGRTLIAPA